MIRWLRGVSLCVPFLLLVLVSAPVAAQDAVIVGTVTAAGATVDVPVSVRDRAGTALGVDRPAGSKIQALSIKVTYAPASAVQAVTFSRAGVTRNLTPIFETSPAGSGSASLVMSFDEGSNPIPFTLNGTDQVAHLVFTLSSTAAPSSSIALALDPGLTQLSDAGGTASTKETFANGRLTLVDGRIDIPALSVSLSPSSRTIASGKSATLEARLSSAAPGPMTIGLSSSNPSVATVPTSVAIAAGQSGASFPVTATAVGTATITAAITGSTDTTSIVVIADTPVVCDTPATPQLSAPPDGDTGAPYTISWNAVDDATEYLVEESADEAFTEATSQTVSGNSASFTHADAGTRYYRVRARNHRATCDRFSSYSSVVSVIVSGSPVPVTHVLPVVGSGPGNLGSFFKTALQLYNPHESSVSGRIVFHPAGTSGSTSDPSLSFTLAPGKTLAFGDLLPAMGVASGLGSADLITDAGSPPPVALSRVFNDAGSGTSGLGQEMLSLDRALQSGETSMLFAPDDTARFRLNIGVRTLADGAALTITVRDEDGTVVKRATRAYEPTYFSQVSSSAFLDDYTLAGGETITVELTSGSAFIYGATTDNATNDPSVQLATRLD